MIFCVEDDDGIRNMVVYTLNASGYKAEGFRDGAEFTEALKSVKPELVMLDIMLPGDDGITLLKRLKENPITADIPVIMATAKGTEYDKVTGLDLGADDYLAKPFGMMEMVSRVRAVLRRSKPAESADLLTAEGLVLNPTEHTVTVDGERVQLTLKEYELLRLFMESFLFYLSLLQTNGFAVLREKWLENAKNLGKEITVRQSGKEEKGIFAGIDENAALLLKTPAGTKRILAGDVFLNR